jgi:hypothetical protein
VADHIEFRFLGGDRFMVDLRTWRDRTKAQMMQAAKDEANRIVSLIANDMPHGDMRVHLRAYLERDTADAFAFRVHSPSPVSGLWEFGTKLRQVAGDPRTIFIKALRAGGQGFRTIGPSRGKMPKRNVFVPSAIAGRERFHVNCRKILEQPVPAIGAGSPEVRGNL